MAVVEFTDKGNWVNFMHIILWGANAIGAYLPNATQYYVMEVDDV